MTLHLPPLPNFGVSPPLPPTGRNVLDVVADEHRSLLNLCAELNDTSIELPRRCRMAQAVTAALSRHLSAEEQYLYPAARAAVPDGEQLADREVAEDHAILVTLRQLAAVSSDESEFARLAGAVEIQLRRHADAVAADLLPLLLQMATTEELVRLGNRLQTAQEAAPTRPHPSTPATAPWNRVIDPTVGVIDRVRDAIGRRATRLGDS